MLRPLVAGTVGGAAAGDVSNLDMRQTIPKVNKPLHAGTLRIQAVLLGALLIYGFVVDPDTGEGGIPCLWKAVFSADCFGCGLSRAGAFLLRGQVTEAVAMNGLIIPVVILVAWKFLGDSFGVLKEGIRGWRNWGQLNLVKSLRG